jgi:large-conductance mechanosensitive channel
MKMENRADTQPHNMNIYTIMWHLFFEKYTAIGLTSLVISMFLQSLVNFGAFTQIIGLFSSIVGVCISIMYAVRLYFKVVHEYREYMIKTEEFRQAKKEIQLLKEIKDKNRQDNFEYLKK